MNEQSSDLAPVACDGDPKRSHLSPLVVVPADAIDRSPPQAGQLPAQKAIADLGMRKTAVQGIAWIVSCYGLMLILRFCTNLILTWLLAPRIVGVMALVNTVVLGLVMFSDLGIRQCVVQHQRGDDPVFLRTAWSLQILRGFFLWFSAILVAWPLTIFYGEPALIWLIPTAGATAVFDGFQSTAVFTLSRGLHRGRLVLLEVGPFLVGMALLIGWLEWLANHHLQDSATLQNRQLTALAAGLLCSALCKMVLSYLIQPGLRHRFCLDREVMSYVLGFGGWIFVSTACNFLGTQADKLVVGKISLNVLGVYHVAVQLAAIPTLLILTLGSQIVFPLFSRAMRGESDLRAVYARVHPVLSGFAALLATGLVCVGPTFVDCVYRSRYNDAGWYLQLLAVGSWFTMLQSTRDMVLVAKGRTRLSAAGQVVRLLALPPLVLGGFQVANLTGLILGFTTAEFLRYLVMVWLVREQRRSLIMNDILLTLLIVGMYLATSFIGSSLAEQAPRFARFALESGFVLAMWTVVFAVWQFSHGQVFRGLSRRTHTEEVRP